METPFLLAYLERKAGDATSPHRDLLWKYYIHHRQFAAAAKRLAQRAEADECVCGARGSSRVHARPLILGCMWALTPHSPTLTLDQRLDYLTRALTAAKSAPAGRADGISSQLLQDLEESAEVGEARTCRACACERAPQTPWPPVALVVDAL